jgi:hypothetical protein
MIGREISVYNLQMLINSKIKDLELIRERKCDSDLASAYMMSNEIEERLCDLARLAIDIAELEREVIRGTIRME